MPKFEKSEEIDRILAGLKNDQARLYVQSYCRFLSKTRAAEDANIAQPQSAGWRYYHRTDIYEAIQAVLKIIAMAPEENVSLIKQNAEFRLSDYFTKQKRFVSIPKKIVLSRVLSRKEAELSIEQDFLLDNSLSALDETRQIKLIKRIEREIKLLKAELLDNPKAFRVENVYEEVEEEVLDINKLVRDKIPLKSVKYTKDGLQVETYSAQAAQDTLAKINGSFETHNKQLAPVINNNLSPEHVKEIANKLEYDV